MCLAGAYGVVTMPFSVREGINIFLSGFVPTENLRFREEALTFKVLPDLFAPQIWKWRLSWEKSLQFVSYEASPCQACRLFRSLDFQQS